MCNSNIIRLKYKKKEQKFFFPFFLFFWNFFILVLKNSSAHAFYRGIYANLFVEKKNCLHVMLIEKNLLLLCKICKNNFPCNRQLLFFFKATDS